MSAPPQPRTTGWPSVPKVLVNAIGDRYDNVYVATRFPSDLQQLAQSGVGVVRVVRTGGANRTGSGNRDRFTDLARVAIDVVHATEGQAEDLAEYIRTWLIDPPSTIWGAGSMIDGCECEIAPHEVPYTDPTVSQFSMVVITSTRRMETHH